MATDDWQKAEYEELHRYGRTVYETFFRLAQMTFIFNGTLGTGFGYILIFKDKFVNTLYFGLFISILGIVYKIGTVLAYYNSHKFLNALLGRINTLEEGGNRGQLYAILAE